MLINNPRINNKLFLCDKCDGRFEETAFGEFVCNRCGLHLIRYENKLYED